MRLAPTRHLIASALVGAALAVPLVAQESDEAAGAATSDAEARPHSVEPQPRLFPDVDVYFPEADLDFRLSGLLKGAYWGGQLRYNFIGGDIQAFLRYRYYGRQRVYQLSLFDSLEFEPIEKGSNDFERTRGGLLLFQWPHSFHRRTFLITELDRITSSKDEFRFTTNRTNTFIRLGFQFGTPDDPRSNAIVGESRAFLEELFTVHRKIGPHRAGFSTALTWGFDAGPGDFNYVKGEFSALKRLDFRPGLFLVARLDGGTFLSHQTVRDDPELPLVDQLSIPRPEFFRLDGRNKLKGLQQRLRGTDTLLLTTELFLPWFQEEQRQAMGVVWQSLYWILYAGHGAIAFDTASLGRGDSYLTDVGFGCEASFRLRDYTVFLGAILAYTVDFDDAAKFRISVKATH